MITKFIKNLISDFSIWYYNKKNKVELISEAEYIDMLKTNKITRVVVLTEETMLCR